MRQTLKRPNEIFEPDTRSKSFVRFDAAGERPRTINDHYADISTIRLYDKTPDAIRDEFETIRNLYLYSWYVYEFTVPAIIYAHALVEQAIKEKCKRADVSLEGVGGLSKLLKICICKGWLTNAAFPFALEWTRTEIIPSAKDIELPKFRTIPLHGPTATTYCEIIANTMPRIRNMYAHGETGLGFPTSCLRYIEKCACIINALFADLED